MNWIYLILGGLIEIGFTTCMRFVRGENAVFWFAGLLICLVSSITFVQMSIRTIPLGTAYAVWTAIGTSGTVLLGALAFDEPVSVTRLILISIIIVCVIGLKITES